MNAILDEDQEEILLNIFLEKFNFMKMLAVRGNLDLQIS